MNKVRLRYNVGNMDNRLEGRNVISVIIPTYNRANTIERSAKSVLNQTYKDLELIIVDDCSSDNTEEIVANLAEHDDRVCYIRHEKNKGACAARNAGIDAARGEYIAFQDSDDVWRPEKLEKQIEVLQKYEADICYCRIQQHNYSSSGNCYYPNGLQEGTVDYEKFLSGFHASTQTLLAKAEVFREHRFDKNLKMLQDFDWCIRAGKNYVVAYTDEVLADVYLQEDSITSLRTTKKMLETYETFLQKYKDVEKYSKFLYVNLLDTTGRLRTSLGYTDGREFKMAFNITKSARYMTKYVACRAGLLRAYYSYCSGQRKVAWNRGGGGTRQELIKFAAYYYSHGSFEREVACA